MIELKKRNLLIEIIEGVSSRINFKALDRALSYDLDDLNYTLKRYYDEAHYIKENNFMFWEFMELNDLILQRDIKNLTTTKEESYLLLSKETHALGWNIQMDFIHVLHISLMFMSM